MFVSERTVRMVLGTIRYFPGYLTDTPPDSAAELLQKVVLPASWTVEEKPAETAPEI